MRGERVMMGCLVFALTGCDRHADGPSKTAHPVAGIRREGLWRQTVTRDGRTALFGQMQVCVDAATDARMTLIGHAVGGSRCTRATAPRPDGAIDFHAVCSFGRAGVIDSTGAVRSDFSSTYRLHAVSKVRGSIYSPMNGAHVTDISANYVGPCPSGMSPGEIIVGPGIKLNLDRVPIAGAAAALG